MLCFLEAFSISKYTLKQTCNIYIYSLFSKKSIPKIYMLTKSLLGIFYKCVILKCLLPAYLMILIFYNCNFYYQYSDQSVSSVAQPYSTLQPHVLQHARLPCYHQLLELNQTPLVHWVGDAVQPSHALSSQSPSPPAFNPSQHQGLFKCISPSHQVAKVLEFQFQHQSLQ